MARVVKSSDVRRKELIHIALRQFMEQGYEQTSVRSILKEAGGEIGMFYHYFRSKNEIYEAALECYNEQYLHHMSELVGDSNLDFEEKLSAIFDGLSDSLSEYGVMRSAKTNPDIMTILLSRTLLSMVPLFEQLILDGIRAGTVGTPVPNVRLLSQFILFGTSAIIHDVEVKSMEEKLTHIRTLIDKLLGGKEGRGAQ